MSRLDDEHIEDRLERKMLILESCVDGARHTLNQYEKNSPTTEGLFFSFIELRELVEEILKNNKLKTA